MANQETYCPVSVVPEAHEQGHERWQDSSPQEWIHHAAQQILIEPASTDKFVDSLTDRLTDHYQAVHHNNRKVQNYSVAKGVRAALEAARTHVVINNLHELTWPLLKEGQSLVVDDAPSSQELYSVNPESAAELPDFTDPDCDKFIRSMMTWMQYADENATNKIKEGAHPHQNILHGFRKAHTGLYRAIYQLPDVPRKEVHFDPDEMIKRGRREIAGASLDLLVASGLAYSFHENPKPAARELTNAAAHRINQMEWLAQIRRGLRAKILPLGISKTYDQYKQGEKGVGSIREIADSFCSDGELTGYNDPSLHHAPDPKLRGFCSGVFGLQSSATEDKLRDDVLKRVTSIYGASIALTHNGLPSPVIDILTTLGLPIAHETIYRTESWPV